MLWYLLYKKLLFYFMHLYPTGNNIGPYSFPANFWIISWLKLESYFTKQSSTYNMENIDNIYVTYEVPIPN